MDFVDIEAIEAAWRVLSWQPSEAAQNAASALVASRDEIDDAGVIDRLNEGRSARHIIVGLVTMPPRGLRANDEARGCARRRASRHIEGRAAAGGVGRREMRAGRLL